MTPLPSPEEVLKRFMKEFFPFGPLLKAGIFTKDMKGDYKAQAKRICYLFGYKQVYEYRAKEIRCHLTLAERNGEPFTTVLPSIYE